MKPKIKICGLKHNVAQVASLQPDYLGFIFYEKSLRNFEGNIPKIPSEIKKVGVFVNENMERVLEIANKHSLDVIQLHGEESPEYCRLLFQQNKVLEIWKVFSVGQDFNFKVLKPYETFVSKFLFDTQGIHKGGNGIVFNWEILSDYPSQKEFIISGGIGLEEIDALKKLITEQNVPLHAIDVNSKLEDQPGLKNTTKLKQFIHELSSGQ